MRSGMVKLLYEEAVLLFVATSGSETEVYMLRAGFNLPLPEQLSTLMCCSCRLVSYCCLNLRAEILHPTSAIACHSPVEICIYIANYSQQFLFPSTMPTRLPTTSLRPQKPFSAGGQENSRIISFLPLWKGFSSFKPRLFQHFLSFASVHAPRSSALDETGACWVDAC